MSETKRSNTRVAGFKDAEMDFQLLRQLGSTYSGGSSIGETLNIASSIKNETSTQWVDAFSKKALSLKEDAQKRALNSHKLSAHEQYLKASNSYRAAEYYEKIDNPKHKEFGLNSRECFIKAMKLSSYTFEESFIDYKNLKLPYYFISTDNKKRKTIIIINGFDGTLEESYLQSGKSALERGYNVVLFAGPGQMDTLRFNTTHFEYDYENPIKALLDRVLIKHNIDEEQLALYGISFGGYFALRTVCFEPRIKAFIANSPIINLHDYMVGFIGYDPAKVDDSQDFRIEDLPNFSDEEFPSSYKESAEALMIRFNKNSFRETFKYMNKFQIENNLSDISIPTLALVGSGEGEEPKRQFNIFCDSVKNCDSYIFSEYEGADSHCQLGNLNFSNCVIYDWLDEKFTQ
ncbi:MAG: alpha/beta hydrolase [Helicobacteraceae bacterium]|nr:alpha/beta hydrolase [Helicobacteraceae bacterium]